MESGKRKAESAGKFIWHRGLTFGGSQGKFMHFNHGQ
jgi:hypothetical protein